MRRQADERGRSSIRVAARWTRGAVALRARTARSSPKFTKLAIFDFDGTLFRSPPPPEDADEPESWWSSPESLGAETVGERPGPEMWHPETVRALRDAIADPDAYVVVMTGRHRSLRHRLGDILDGAGLHPDELITNPEIGNTSGYKRDEMRYLLRQFPNVREVEFWEDREEDLKGYRRLAEGQGMRFVPKLVRNYEDKTPPYVGVFLTPEARREILRDFPPRHPDVKADHVTLLFRPSKEQVDDLREQLGMGRRVPVRVTGVAEDGDAQALEVELPEEIARHAGRRPHVTVSVEEGVEPVYSNELLGRGVRPVEPKVYEGYLDAGPRMAEEKPREEPGPKRWEPGTREKRRIWREFLQTETRNPEYGKPGHHKDRILRKTLYDAGPAGRRQVMREWGPYLQQRRGR